MGVRGLLSLVCSHESPFLEPYKLCNTTLLIDGGNFCNVFYVNCQRSEENNVFGGDYDSFYLCVTKFFDRLSRCGVKPIVLFDGCPPEEKFETLKQRRESKLRSLIDLHKGKRYEYISPMLMFNVFLDGLDDIGVKYLRLYEEADQEIAAVAKHLNCPVLSNDSDFIIYDVDVIPPRTMDFTWKEDEDGSWYFPCFLYRSGNLSRVFPGLEKPILPMVSVIMGNDWMDKNFTDVFTEKGPWDLDGILQRLRTFDNIESVIAEILQSLEESEVEGVKLAIRDVVKRYDVPFPISLSRLDEGGQTTRDTVPVVYGLDLSGLPDKFLKFYESCKLDPFIIGLMRYKTYNLSILIEDIKKSSAHYPSIPIIREIYKILRTLVSGPEQFTLNVRIRKNLLDMKEICPKQDYTSAKLRGNVLNETEDFRRDFFFQSLGLDCKDRKSLIMFDEDWTLFVMSVMYWMRNTSQLGKSHLSAVLLMALCNYVKSMGGRVGKGRARAHSNCSFSKLLERIPNAECATFVDRLKKVVKSDRAVLARPYFFPAIHAFVSLQSVLYHILQFNNLLGQLLGKLQVARFYSGSFLCSIFFALMEKQQFAEVVMEDLPGMHEAYAVLEKTVSSYLLPPSKR